jgi:capsular polysaccharide biosynthesis protein/Mrp family chromosome partitioning ATPase
MIIVFGVIGAVAAYSVSFLLPTSYTAQSSVYLSAAAPFSPSGEASGEPVRFTADQVELVLTSEVLERAGRRFNPPLTVEDIRSSVSAGGSVESSRMTITVERAVAQEAKALADAIAGSYRELAGERVSDLSSAAQDAINDGFIEEQIRLRAAAYGDGVTAIEPASVPTEPSAPLHNQNALIGGFIGLLLGTGVAVLREQRRARRASVADLDLLIGAPLIARYPGPASTSPAHLVDMDPSPEKLHAVHDVLAAIDVALEGEPRRSVLFLSWQRPLTTTSLVVSAGMEAARTGRDVVLIDGGLKDHGLSTLIGGDKGLGLEALADPDMPVTSVVRTWDLGGVSQVKVVPLDGRTPAPTGAAARPQVLRAATARLGAEASLVLVDGPPLTERSLGLALGRGVDGVILMIDEKTTIDDAHEMGRRVALSGVRVLGYVLAGQPAHKTGTWSPRRRGESPVPLDAAMIPWRS